MKKGIVYFVLALSTLFFVQCQQAQGQQKLTPVEYQKALLKDSSATLLDIRTPDEFQEGHLIGAKNINFYDAQFLTQVKQTAKNNTVYIYCRSGGRSSKASTLLQEAGLKVIDLSGGIQAWMDQSLPITQK